MLVHGQNWSRCPAQSASPRGLQHARSKPRCLAPAAASSFNSSSSRVDTNVEEGTSSSSGSSSSASYASKRLPQWPALTGGVMDFRGSTDPLTATPLTVDKRVMLVRHGMSTWNNEGRIQGSSDLSLLSEHGIQQVERCRRALSRLKFDKCYASPISRAKSSAEVIWSGREEPLIFLDSLREANLLCLEGMRNEDARIQFPEMYKVWREDPANFNVDGIYPIVTLWERAKKAWQEILSSSGDLVLVVTHKSILRALICTALGLPPERFRSFEIHNSGVSTFSVKEVGGPMLESLNATTHLYSEDIYYF